MTEWIEFGKTFGAYVLIIAALFVFIYLFVWKLLWPFILSQQEKSEKAKEQERLDRIAERDKFIQSLAARDEMMKEVVSSLHSLTTEVRKNNGNGRTK